MSGLAPIVLVIIFRSEVVLMSHSTTRRDDLFCLPFIQYFSCLLSILPHPSVEGAVNYFPFSLHNKAFKHARNLTHTCKHWPRRFRST